MSSFSFTFLKDKTNKTLMKKEVLEYLSKWSMKGNLRTQYYCFNEPFKLYQKQNLVEAFFRDPCVLSTLEVEPSVFLEKPCSRVEYHVVPCTITSMRFFESLLDPTNKVVYDDQAKSLRICEHSEVDGFVVADNLRKVLLEETEDEMYSLFSHSERNQFLFRLFKHLCLGGLWCQYEDSLKPYLDVTKDLYKSLLRVEKEEHERHLIITSFVLEVVVFDENGDAILPKNPGRDNNFAYLIIDPSERTVSTLVHQVGHLIL